MWETIDTAPKDGTTMLLFCPDCTRKVQFGYFVDEESLQYGVSVATRQGWSVNGQTIGSVSPSHWMPMPADPE